MIGYFIKAVNMVYFELGEIPFMSSSGVAASSAIAGGSENRTFVFEVAGFTDCNNSAHLEHPIRESGNAYIRVPFRRMNQEIRRINSLGGRIISIQPLNSANSASTPAIANSSAPSPAPTPKKAMTQAKAKPQKRPRKHLPTQKSFCR